MMTTPVPLPPDFPAFLSLSARLGADITRTQGAGGNTSLKDGDVLWIKASGTWLSRAQETPIMVPVNTAAMRRALDEDPAAAEAVASFLRQDLNTAGLRPSIETSFHAVLDAPVVVHIHCVNTIAQAVLADGEAVIGARLAAAVPELSWRFVPYCRPGVPIALAMLEAGGQADVWVLGNHGLVIAAADVAAAADRVERVTAALAMPVRPAGTPDPAALEALAAGTDYRPATDAGAHAAATTPESLALATAGPLYPDHVIFLGEEVDVLPEGGSVADVVADAAGRGRPAPKLILVPGRGVLVARDLTPGGEAMARCLAEVVRRIPLGQPLRVLDARECYALTHWEAETYRQSLDRQSAGRSA